MSESKDLDFSTLNFTTCEISDALIKLGLLNGGHIPDINLYSPAPPNPNFRVSGPAYTVKMVHASDQTAPKVPDLVPDIATTGSIVIIDAPPGVKSAVWGGLMTAGAKARGVAGVVISGRCRDLAQHRAASFPVFARGHSTVGQLPISFVHVSAVNVPLVIQPQDNTEGANAFSAVTVEPGDWIIADEDGVVSVPKEMAYQVVELARIGRKIEAKIREDTMACKGLKASAELHGMI